MSTMSTNELSSPWEGGELNHQTKEILSQTYYNAFSCTCKSIAGHFSQLRRSISSHYQELYGSLQ
jgi:hypothetical protein